MHSKNSWVYYVVVAEVEKFPCTTGFRVETTGPIWTSEELRAVHDKIMEVGKFNGACPEQIISSINVLNDGPSDQRCQVVNAEQVFTPMP